MRRFLFAVCRQQGRAAAVSAPFPCRPARVLVLLVASKSASAASSVGARPSARTSDGLARMPKISTGDWPPSRAYRKRHQLARRAFSVTRTDLHSLQTMSVALWSFLCSGVPRHSDRHQIEFCMFAVLRLCRVLTSQNLVPEHFSIAHHRSEVTSDMTRFVGTKVGFDADTDEFALNANARELLLIHADAYLNNLLLKYCEAALADRRGDMSQLRTRVENAISSLSSAWKGARGRHCSQSGNEQENAGPKA
jgi:hypothetical protein